MLSSFIMHSHPRVWSMVVEPTFKNAMEARAFDYFRRFVLSQCDKRLCTLLHFITGKPQCGLQSITVQFHVPCMLSGRKATPPYNLLGNPLLAFQVLLYKQLITVHSVIAFYTCPIIVHAHFKSGQSAR